MGSSGYQNQFKKKGKKVKLPSKTVQQYVKSTISKSIGTRETKSVLNSGTFTNLLTTPTGGTMTVLAAGSGQANRIGNEIRVMSIWWNFLFYLPESSIARIIIARQKGSPRRAELTATLVNTNFDTTVDLDDFTILADKYFIGASVASHKQLSFKTHYPSRMRPKAIYTDTAASEASNIGGAIFYTLVASINTVTVTARNRLFFTDA